MRRVILRRDRADALHIGDQATHAVTGTQDQVCHWPSSLRPHPDDHPVITLADYVLACRDINNDTVIHGDTANTRTGVSDARRRWRPSRARTPLPTPTLRPI